VKERVKEKKEKREKRVKKKVEMMKVHLNINQIKVVMKVIQKKKSLNSKRNYKIWISYSINKLIKETFKCKF